MRIALVMLMAVLMLGACSEKSKRAYFDGKYYPSKAKHQSREDRKIFTATVRKAAQGLEGARAAALHVGTRYCIENFGTSKIDWIVGPKDDQSAIVSPGGNVVVSGECKIW